MFGISFREAMEGSYFLFASPVRDRAVRVEATAIVGASAFRSRTARLEGRVTAEGIAYDAPFRGTVALHVEDRRLRYEFVFVGADGERRAFRGQKDHSLLAFGDAVTLLTGSLYDAADAEVGRARLRVTPPEWPAAARKVLASMRVVRR